MKHKTALAAIGLVAVFFGFSGLAGAQTFACGDDNGDGSITVADVFYLVNNLFAGGAGPTNCPPPAGVEKTGQTTCWDGSGNPAACLGTGQDGEKLKGLAWPLPRFTDNGDGTVTDNMTGLVWLKIASCVGIQTWTNALASANGLASGACGLSDGSIAGNWRLPNVRELQSLIHFGFDGPALSNAAGTAKWVEGDPFSGVTSANYWTSSTYVNVPTLAWQIHLGSGALGGVDEASSNYVWPVKGGQ